MLTAQVHLKERDVFADNDFTFASSSLSNFVFSSSALSFRDLFSKNKYCPQFISIQFIYFKGYIHFLKLLLAPKAIVSPDEGPRSKQACHHLDRVHIVFSKTELTFFIRFGLAIKRLLGYLSYT